MAKIDPTVRRETGYIAVWTLLFSLLMEAVYLLLHRWEPGVLFGNLLGAAAAILNFLLMGLTVQRAVGKEEKEAANLMKLSQAGRMFMLVLVGLAVALIPVFKLLPTLIPLFFPRLAVAIRPLLDRKKQK